MLVLGIIALIALAVCNLCGTQFFGFVMGGISYSADKQTDEQIIKLQQAVDTQCGIGVATINRDGFWSDTPRQPDYGWSNNQVSCRGNDRLQQNQIQCTCSK